MKMSREIGADDAAPRRSDPIGLCQPVSYFLAKLLETERLGDIADAPSFELSDVSWMPGHQDAGYPQRSGIARDLGAKTIRQSDVDHRKIDLERGEQRHRRRFLRGKGDAKTIAFQRCTDHLVEVGLV